MASNRVRYSKQALADLHSIKRYIAERNPAAAERVIASIQHSISNLENHPLMGIREPNGNGRLLFESRYRYVISYSVSGREVQIRYIFHPRRNRRS